MKNKIGLLLSHIYVLKQEGHKFSWVKDAINRYKSLGVDFYIVLAGHGQTPPDFILELVDDIIWEESIDNKQIGKGHPKFCIAGFKKLYELGIEKTLKSRAYDFIDNKLIFEYELAISEQTSLEHKKIGDLLQYGYTKFLLDWWTAEEWDYTKDGLYNLYVNAQKLMGLKGFQELAKFGDPLEFGWRTYEPKGGYWGPHKGYRWYGGF